MRLRPVHSLQVAAATEEQATNRLLCMPGQAPAAAGWAVFPAAAFGPAAVKSLHSIEYMMNLFDLTCEETETQ